MNTYADYGIESEFLELNGVQTNQQVITQNGKFVASLDGKYTILANEEVTNAIPEICERTGLVPMDMPTQNWFHKKPKGQYVYKNKYGATTKSLWFLTSPEPLTFADGSKYFKGVVLKNSTDGAWIFGADEFIYRQMCANAIPMFRKQRQLQFSEDIAENAKKVNEQIANEQQYIRTNAVYRRHTRSLEIDSAIESIELLVAEHNPERFDMLQKIAVDKKQAVWIANNMPKWVREAENHLSDELSVADIITVEKDRVDFKEGTNAWQLHCALTNALTHEGKTFMTTMTNFQKVDNYFAKLVKNI